MKNLHGVSWENPESWLIYKSRNRHNVLMEVGLASQNIVLLKKSSYGVVASALIYILHF